MQQGHNQVRMPHFRSSHSPGNSDLQDHSLAREFDCSLWRSLFTNLNMFSRLRQKLFWFWTSLHATLKRLKGIMYQLLPFLPSHTENQEQRHRTHLHALDAPPALQLYRSNLYIAYVNQYDAQYNHNIVLLCIIRFCTGWHNIHNILLIRIKATARLDLQYLISPGFLNFKPPKPSGLQNPAPTSSYVCRAFAQKLSR